MDARTDLPLVMTLVFVGRTRMLLPEEPRSALGSIVDELTSMTFLQATCVTDPAEAAAELEYGRRRWPKLREEALGLLEMLDDRAFASLRRRSIDHCVAASLHVRTLDAASAALTGALAVYEMLAALAEHSGPNGGPGSCVPLRRASTALEYQLMSAITNLDGTLPVLRPDRLEANCHAAAAAARRAQTAFERAGLLARTRPPHPRRGPAVIAAP